MLLEKFEKFLQSVNLESYREQYRHIKLVEMDLPKEIQAVGMLYKIYWDQKKFATDELLK
ncbi:MAG: TaqI family restriction endonuclease [Candidatus Jacksonbacteria bacterium]|nr:TaqI family restriction endonuclease [Candidatus Jacksonbacteria bacterium]